MTTALPPPPLFCRFQGLALVPRRRLGYLDRSPTNRGRGLARSALGNVQPRLRVRLPVVLQRLGALPMPNGDVMRFAALLVLLAAVIALPRTASAEKIIWKYDQLDPDMNVLANGLANHPLYAHPGFVAGEAFGQIYKPKPEDYPVKILSVELVMAQAKNAAGKQKIDAIIEFYNDDGAGPAPKGGPIWSVSTKDFALGPQIGVPIQGDTAMVYEFDWSKPDNHPPLIDKGNIWVMIRILDQAQDLTDYWGKLECIKQNIAGVEVGCGCQKLAALSDSATTPGANIIHLVWPLGTCSGQKQWKFVEQIAKDGVQMKGDFLLRLGVDGVPPPPPPVDAGSTETDAGPTETDAGTSPDVGKPDAGTTDTAPLPDTAGTPDTSSSPDIPVPPLPPSIDNLTPASGPADKPVQIDVYGKGFQKGLTAKLGTEAIAVEQGSVTATAFTATVVGLAPGVYDLVVKNPDGQVAFKTAAYKVEAPAPDVVVAPDVSQQPEVTQAPDVTQAPEVSPETAGGTLTLEAVTPACVAADKDTLITVLGTGFQSGLKLRLDGTELLAVEVSSGSKATALVPKGLKAATYTLYAEQAGTTKVLANAVTVGACGNVGVTPGSAASGGCTAAPRSTDNLPVWLGLLGLVGLAVRRRLA